MFFNLRASCMSPSCPCNDGIRQTYEQFFPKMTQRPLLQRQMGSTCKENSSCLQAAHEGNMVHGTGSPEQCGKCMHNAFRVEVYYGYRHHIWEQPRQSIQPGMFQRSVGNIKPGVGEMFPPLCRSVLAEADSLLIHSQDKS